MKQCNYIIVGSNGVEVCQEPAAQEIKALNIVLCEKHYLRAIQQTAYKQQINEVFRFRRVEPECAHKNTFVDIRANGKVVRCGECGMDLSQ